VIGRVSCCRPRPAPRNPATPPRPESCHRPRPEDGYRSQDHPAAMRRANPPTTGCQRRAARKTSVFYAAHANAQSGTERTMVMLHVCTKTGRQSASQDHPKRTAKQPERTANATTPKVQANNKSRQQSAASARSVHAQARKKAFPTHPPPKANRQHIRWRQAQNLAATQKWQSERNAIHTMNAVGAPARQRSSSGKCSAAGSYRAHSGGIVVRRLPLAKPTTPRPRQRRWPETTPAH